jgi:putative glutamine amidotransferase
MGIRKPIIGIPVNVLVDKSWAYAGVERAYVNQDYIKSVKLAGGVPVLLPIVCEEDDIEAQLSVLDGLLFSGGADVGPLNYGEEPVPGLEDVFPEMDVHQLALARQGTKRQLSMLGICRGMQVLNVAFGGTLHQDLHTLPENLLQHVQKSQRHAVCHTVDLVEDSQLRAIFGQATLSTNSFHHQAVKALAPGFRVSAKARDGVMEGLEREDGAYMVGVQWHPEGMVDKHPLMLKLFRSLVEACEKANAR